MNRRSHEPLEKALATLLSEKRADHYGRWYLMPFLRDVAEAHGNYSAGGIRSMVDGRARPNLRVLEIMAELLGVAPDHFLQYRMGRVEEALQTRPDLVDDLYDLLLALEKEMPDKPGASQG